MNQSRKAKPRRPSPRSARARAPAGLTAITNVTALINRRLVPDAVVLVHAGHLEAAGPAGKVRVPRGARPLNGRGHLVVPGFVDIHIHGSGGYRAEDGVISLARHVVRHGTTWFLPTFISNAFDRMLAAIDHVRVDVGPVPGGATIGGIHLEGPFLNPKYGAQRPETNIEPNPERVRQLIDHCGDTLRLVTLAPERPGALDAIRAFCAAGATVAIGHSDATEAEYQAGRAAGITHATHLFNAMPPRVWATTQTFAGVKTVGIEELILGDEGVTADILCDCTAAHVHPALLKAAFRAKGIGNLSLITDAMPQAGLPGREHKLADGQTVYTHPGEDVARLANGVLCGSVMSLAGALRNFLNHTGMPLEQALTLVAEAPARAVGIFDRKGSLAPGKDADLVFLDRNLDVQQVLIAGRVEHTAHKTREARGSSDERTAD
ncbi:N-acetylglucosamine-6-phosphate deacetylase [bacterium]|nr:N-acetylglucosamine-6-phosphate deacetylase [bacterium]